MIIAYSGAVSTEQIKSGHTTSSGVKFQFKSPVGKNLGSENPLGKNVSRLTWSKKFSLLAIDLCATLSHSYLVAHHYVSYL